jgi:hypothetical protein
VGRAVLEHPGVGDAGEFHAIDIKHVDDLAVSVHGRDSAIVASTTIIAESLGENRCAIALR